MSTSGWLQTYGDGKFVAVSYYSNKGAYSNDGLNWVETTLPSTSSWNGVAYGNNKYVAVAGNNTNIAAYSADGITW
jgi:hypothetical protein